jgi:nitrogen regulatory protein P-II 1
MIRIEAIIRPTRLDEVKSALNAVGVSSMSVAEVRGVGRQKGYTQHYRGSEYKINLLPKLMVVLVVRDEQQEAVVDAILDGARTGEIGDGKIFIMPLQEAIRIRTGDRGDEAVS